MSLCANADRLGGAAPSGQEDAHVSTAQPDRRPPAPDAERPRRRGPRIRTHGRDGRRPARAMRMFGGRVRGADPGHADDGAPLGSHPRRSEPACRSLGSLAGAVPREPRASGTRLLKDRRPPGPRRRWSPRARVRTLPTPQAGRHCSRAPLRNKFASRARRRRRTRAYSHVHVLAPRPSYEPAAFGPIVIDRGKSPRSTMRSSSSGQPGLDPALRCSRRHARS